MDDRQFDRELKYQVSMGVARQMLETGIFDTDAFAKWQEKLIARNYPPIGWIISNREG